MENNRNNNSENSNNSTSTSPSPFLLYGKDGKPVWIPPELADLFRDLPPEPELEPMFSEEEDVLHEGQGLRPRLNCGHRDISGSMESVHVVKPEEEEEEEDEGDGHGMQEEEEEEFEGLVQHIKSTTLRLIPFMGSCFIYFTLFIPDDQSSWEAVGVKCLPIVSLVAFIALNGLKGKYRLKILLGLVFSGIGDGFLVWSQYFLHGMTAFAMAQICYIWSFGFHPINTKVGVSLYFGSSLVLSFLGEGIRLEPWLVRMGIFVYSGLLVCTLWRAISRLNLGQEEGKWTGCCSFLGAFFFTVSDIVLALNRYQAPVPHHQTIIMTTYYAGQLFHALSTLSSPPAYYPYKKEE